MGFWSNLWRLVPKQGEYPRVEMYKFNERKPENKYDVRLDRVTSEGNPKCWHDWHYVPCPRPYHASCAEWIEKHGEPVDYANGFEYIRKVYVCGKCEAECTILFSRYSRMH